MSDDEQDPIWQSALVAELVEGWTDDEIADLCNDLDQAVMLTIADHEARRSMTTGDTEV